MYIGTNRRIEMCHFVRASSVSDYFWFYNNEYHIDNIIDISMYNICTVKYNINSRKYNTIVSLEK